MEYLKCKDTLEKIMNFLNVGELLTLIQTCKDIRNIVGKSKIWKYKYYCETLSDTYINVKELWKLFLSINIIEKPKFATREYYGKWYYLCIMNYWIGCEHEYWCIYDFFKNIDQLEKLATLTGCLGNHILSACYHEMSTLLPEIKEHIEYLKITDCDKMLKSIYVKPLYIYEELLIDFVITNTKITTKIENGAFKIYPMDFDLQNLKVNDTYIPITVDYKFKRFYNYAIGNGPCSGLQLRNEIEKFAKKMNFDNDDYLKIITEVMLREDISKGNWFDENFSY